MRSRLSFLICFVAAAFLFASCSSTSLVASDERAIESAVEASDDQAADDTSDESETTPPDDDDTDDDGDADETDDPDSTDSESDDDSVDDDEPDDADRGSRDGAATDAEGFGLGGAEQLESLLIDCQDGNDLACDIMFQISAFDSEEELAAETCGGRSDVAVSFCTDGIDAGSDQLSFDPDSDGLERVVEACEVDANMTACDFLYYRSPIDSEFQDIGGTCGDRVNVAVPDCRSSLDE